MNEHANVLLKPFIKASNEFALTRGPWFADKTEYAELAQFVVLSVLFLKDF